MAILSSSSSGTSSSRDGSLKYQYSVAVAVLWHTTAVLLMHETVAYCECVAIGLQCSGTHLQPVVYKLSNQLSSSALRSSSLLSETCSALAHNASCKLIGHCYSKASRCFGMNSSGADMS
jgi:hypothetical protein